MQNCHKGDCHSCDCQGSKVVVGNSVDIDMKNECICKSSEIRSDIVVEQFNAKRIWGQIVDCEGNPIPNSMVKLVKVICCNGKNHYEGIAHSVTNCEGFYQFDICADDCSCYKIIVNKASMGLEVTVDNQGGNCNLCQNGPDGGMDQNGQHYNPCHNQQPHIVVNKMACECPTCQPCQPCCPEPQPPCGCTPHPCPPQGPCGHYPPIIGNSAICR